MSLYGGFDFMFSIFPVIFFIAFALVIGMFIHTFVKSVSQNRKDNASPQLTVEARVVTKRTHVWGDHSRTNYYTTFEVPSGDRMELSIPHDQFGYLVEGDRGKLTFQGTRFLGFERI